jgi:hypothetical protein
MTSLGFGRLLNHPKAGDATSRPNCTVQCSHRSFTGHLNRGIDGIFVRAVSRALVSIAEVHAIVARAHLAQGEPEMARKRFGLLERYRLLSVARK